MKQPLLSKDKRADAPARAVQSKGVSPDAGAGKHIYGAAALPNRLGNCAFQRFAAQRSGGKGAALDDATVARIGRARGGGQVLDASVQETMGEAFGADFSSVHVHTGREAELLNKELDAVAFTTGRDIFFGEGQYNPHASAGRELIAHELTHVVQQHSGAVPSSGRMTVNEPGDRFEQEANAAAKAVATDSTAPRLQRQELPEEELPEEELPEEELPEDQLQAKAAQRQELPEEDQLQAQMMQRQSSEDERDSVVTG